MPDLSELSRRGRRAAQIAGRVAVDAAGWHGGRLSSAETHIAARRLHRLTGGRSSRLLLATLKSVPGSRDRHASIGSLDARWSGALDLLREDGLSQVPDVFDGPAVTRIREFAATAPAVLHQLGGVRVRGTCDDRTETTAAAHVLEGCVLDNPDVQSLLRHEAILELARRYFGIGAVVHPPMLYWTFPTSTLDGVNAARAARRFHWDYDGLGCLRIHVNLTDVDADSAPMLYLAGTHRPGTLRTRPLRAGDSGIPDDLVEEALGTRHARALVGRAGTSYVSDPQGLHRGTDPVDRDRLFMVMPLQASGFAGYQLRPRPINVRDAGLAAGLMQNRPELRMFTRRSEVTSGTTEDAHER